LLCQFKIIESKARTLCTTYPVMIGQALRTRFGDRHCEVVIIMISADNKII
jgi:hypothetical protein